jgi:hypothetical protein
MLSIGSFCLYKRVKATEIALEDATQLAEILNKKTLNENIKSVRNEISRNISSKSKLIRQNLKILDMSGQIDTFINMTTQELKNESINWVKLDKNYQLLTKHIQSNMRDGMQKYFQKILISQDTTQNIAHLPVIAQHYWLKKYEMAAKMTYLRTLEVNLGVFCDFPPRFLINIQPTNAVTKLGENFEAKMTIINQNQLCWGDSMEQTIVINDHKVVLPNYFSTHLYKEKPTTLGKHSITATATIVNTTTGEQQTCREEFNYQVID